MTKRALAAGATNQEAEAAAAADDPVGAFTHLIACCEQDCQFKPYVGIEGSYFEHVMEARRKRTRPSRSKDAGEEEAPPPA